MLWECNVNNGSLNFRMDSDEFVCLVACTAGEHQWRKVRPKQRRIKAMNGDGHRCGCKAAELRVEPVTQVAEARVTTDPRPSRAAHARNLGAAWCRSAARWGALVRPSRAP